MSNIGLISSTPTTAPILGSQSGTDDGWDNILPKEQRDKIFDMLRAFLPSEEVDKMQEKLALYMKDYGTAIDAGKYLNEMNEMCYNKVRQELDNLKEQFQNLPQSDDRLKRLNELCNNFDSLSNDLTKIDDLKKLYDSCKKLWIDHKTHEIHDQIDAFTNSPDFKLIKLLLGETEVNKIIATLEESLVSSMDKKSLDDISKLDFKKLIDGLPEFKNVIEEEYRRSMEAANKAQDDANKAQDDANKAAGKADSGSANNSQSSSTSKNNSWKTPAVNDIESLLSNMSGDIPMFMLVTILLGLFDAVNQSVNSQALKIASHTKDIKFNNALTSAMVSFEKSANGSPFKGSMTEILAYTAKAYDAAKGDINQITDIKDDKGNIIFSAQQAKDAVPFLVLLNDNFPVNVTGNAKIDNVIDLFIQGADKLNDKSSPEYKALQELQSSINQRFSNIGETVGIQKSTVWQLDFSYSTKPLEDGKTSEFAKNVMAPMNDFTSAVANAASSLNQNDASLLQTLQANLTTVTNLLSKAITMLEEVLRKLSN